MRKPLAQGSSVIALGVIWRAIERWTVLDALERSIPGLHSVVFSHTAQGTLIGLGLGWIIADLFAGRPYLTGEVQSYEVFKAQYPDGHSEPRIALWLEVS